MTGCHNDWKCKMLQCPVHHVKNCKGRCAPGVILCGWIFRLGNRISADSESSSGHHFGRKRMCRQDLFVGTEEINVRRSESQRSSRNVKTVERIYGMNSKARDMAALKKDQTCDSDTPDGTLHVGKSHVYNWLNRFASKATICGSKWVDSAAVVTILPANTKCDLVE
mmetsp:Transcript_50019/g.98842  ORF Transcript_50019/g.98842 Transcript_50019/m.98842 type:complete len:167 (-) Transcript_50019:183-683(-)